MIIKKIFEGLKSYVVLGIFLSLIILLSPVLIPIHLIMEVRESASLRRFRRREAGYFYLICTSKRNWHDFLRNNVIPILPSNIKVVWHHPTKKGAYSDLRAHLLRSKIYGVSKPYLVAVTKKELRVKSLNGDLQKLKKKAKLADETRIACLEIIDASQKRLFNSP